MKKSPGAVCCGARARVRETEPARASVADPTGHGHQRPTAEAFAVGFIHGIAIRASSCRNGTAATMSPISYKGTFA